MSNQEAVCGGWTPYHDLTHEEEVVFAKALVDFVGVKYTPNTVSTQVVAGKNYRYKCTASLPGSEGMWDAIVEIFQPLNSDPYIYGIIRI